MTAEDEISLLKARVGALEQLLSVYEVEVERQSDRLEFALREVESQNRLLASTALDLKSVNDELGHFAYIASHDLKEPLRAITSFVTLLRDHYQAQLDEQATEFMGFIVDGAERMRRLIDDLLAYSRLERRPVLAITDLNEAVQEALTNLALLIAETKSTVTFKPLPRAVGERTMLVLLFQNLIANAIKFRRGESAHIELFAVDDEEAWRVCVRDDGIGIKPQHLERVFVIFKRLHSAEKYAGTGLGLAICRKVVETCGGRIWVESTFGVGSTFYFTLPKSLDAQADRASAMNFDALSRSLAQANEELALTQERFKSFMGSGPFIAVIKSAAGAYLYVNDYFEKTFGLPAARVLGHRDGDLWPSEVAKGINQRDHLALQSAGSTETIERLPSLKGELTLLNVRFPFSDAGQKIVLGSIAVNLAGWALETSP